MDSKAALGRILIVCDAADTRTLFESLGKAGGQVVLTSSGAEALRRIGAEPFDLVAVDVDTPGIHSGAFFAKARTLRPTIRRVAFEGSGALESAPLAPPQPAHDCPAKPAHRDGPERVRETPPGAGRVARNVGHLRGPVEGQCHLAGIVGESAPMQHLFRLVRRVAASHSTVLIRGETGTGKELIARAIHRHSPRHGHAFVAVDCGAVSESLLESELLGHVRGAFTGAICGKQGLFQGAHGGTLLLDEVGNTTPAFQAKLLRALQEGEVRPVGGTRSVRVDVRVLASTNTELRRAVEEKAFRQDLYFRLAVVPLAIPPLRQRRADIPLPVEHFLDKFCQRDRLPPKRAAPEALELLVDAPRPGNVRELEHVIERAVVLSSGATVQRQELALPARAPGPPPAGGAPAHRRLEAAAQQVLLQVLREHAGDKRAAARALGIGLSTLYGKLAKLRAEPLHAARSSAPARMSA